jgi:hypothetical protein
MADGFLGRWSRRKTDLREGRPLEEPLPEASTAQVEPVVAKSTPAPATPASETTGAPRQEATPEVELPTMAQVNELTPQSDFTRFVARGVAPDVKIAALKKLFSDPHYSVVDGLDIYLADFSQAAPLPLSMLRKMTSAKAVNMFKDDEETEKPSSAAPPQRESANTSAPQTVAQSEVKPEANSAEAAPPETASPAGSLPGSADSQENHDHTDLRLQPDHAPAASGAGHGTQ